VDPVGAAPLPAADSDSEFVERFDDVEVAGLGAPRNEIAGMRWRLALAGPGAADQHTLRGAREPPGPRSRTEFGIDRRALEDELLDPLAKGAWQCPSGSGSSGHASRQSRFRSEAEDAMLSTNECCPLHPCGPD